MLRDGVYGLSRARPVTRNEDYPFAAQSFLLERLPSDVPRRGEGPGSVTKRLRFREVTSLFTKLVPYLTFASVRASQ